MKFLKLIVLSLTLILCSCTTVSFDKMVGEDVGDEEQKYFEKLIGEWVVSKREKIYCKIEKSSVKMDYKLTLTEEEKQTIFTASPKAIKDGLVVLWLQNNDVEGYVPLRFAFNMDMPNVLTLLVVDAEFTEKLLVNKKIKAIKKENRAIYLNSKVFKEYVEDNNFWNINHIYTLTRKAENK